MAILAASPSSSSPPPSSSSSTSSSGSSNSHSSSPASSTASVASSEDEEFSATNPTAIGRVDDNNQPIAANTKSRKQTHPRKHSSDSGSSAGEETCAAAREIKTAVVAAGAQQSSTLQQTTTVGECNKQPTKQQPAPARAVMSFARPKEEPPSSVSGLQPTLVEWLPPTNQQQQQQQQQQHNQISIKPYYRGGEVSGGGQSLLQFGSKLKILNVSKAHEGIYQCKGKNRLGVEIAPALIKVIDPKQNNDWDAPSSVSSSELTDQTRTARTKVAKYGSNIELKCQVNGVEQPATSWSRDGLELPGSSVQIGHNLWIQNVTSKDNGLYVCSARSREPNRIIQAKVNLLVEGIMLDSKRLKNLEAKIVASKSQVNKGDSITLECIISGGSKNSTSNNVPIEDLEEVERNVVWTNLRSGQTLFQDNVYVLGNLLIIYDLKPENSATYRCNYNDLAQYTDYKLQVLTDPADDQTAIPDATISSDSLNDTAQISRNHTLLVKGGQRVELKQLAVGSRLVLDCGGGLNETREPYYWTLGSQRLATSTNNRQLVINSIKSQDAGVYACHSARQTNHHLVHVLIPVARFTQSPVSFVTLPTISEANQQLEIEMKFLPENDHGLLLFNGQQQQLSALNRSAGFSSIDGDYLSLGLIDGGYLEFKFELGDGPTSLRSSQPLGMNRWHRVMVERNRRGAVMWIDDQPAVSNSSMGKFFNLNLDSVLFVGGHQQFLYGSARDRKLYGYSRGFQGCISLLRISRQEVNLMARNRSVALGVFECHKSECNDNLCSSQAQSTINLSDQSQKHLNGLCQVDRSDFEQRWQPTSGQISAQAGLRCVCAPGLEGDRCSEPSAQIDPLGSTSNRSLIGIAHVGDQTTRQQLGKACELLNPCSADGTLQCQSLTSQSYNCHCKIGFAGADCAKPVVYDDEHSIQFNQHSYLQLVFNDAQFVQSYLQNQSSTTSNGSILLGNTEFNATNYAKQISMGDHQNISFNLQTNSSYGVLFYTGQLISSHVKAGTGRSWRPASSSQLQQISKSMIVNLVSRLSQNSVSDYLAIALIDGHVEVSFELGSGVSILRSIQRVNDDQPHSIQLNRSGKLAKLVIDQVHKYEASSPGRLSVLNNNEEDFYIGGLPLSSSTAHLHPSMIYSTYFANFVGCISQFEINSLGPLNLVNSNHLTEIRSAQNLAPCSGGRQRPSTLSKSLATQPHKPYTSPTIENDDKEPDELK